MSNASPPADISYGTERRGNADRRGAARPSSGVGRRGAAPAYSAGFIWLIVLVLAAGAWIAGRMGFYTPGSDLGYYLGLVGSIFMALLLLYPLRKRLGILRRAGELRHWFKLHMFLGIAGPALVIYHSTLKLGSLNASVAFYSMLLVAGSGIVGRFIYTKIHHGLYGRQATLMERQARLGFSAESVKSQFHFAPRVEERLKTLEAYAMNETRARFLGLRRFVAVALRVRWVYWLSMRDVRRIVSRVAVERDWEPQDRARRLQIVRRMLKGYLRELRDVAQFRVYERLFSLWHILHVPFVYMLVLSAIVHVVAVHMY